MFYWYLFCLYYTTNTLQKYNKIFTCQEKNGNFVEILVILHCETYKYESKTFYQVGGR